MLPFVYATVFPFLSLGKEEENNSLDDSDDEEMHGLEIRKTSTASKKGKGKTIQHYQTVKRVFEWAPSELKGAKSAKSAYDGKIKGRADLKKVQDGFSAPKFTGVSSYKMISTSICGLYRVKETKLSEYHRCPGAIPGVFIYA
jgi:hypothetical protein